MKIVHSFWTKPYLSKGFNKFKGGWFEKQYYYMSWALSCLQFRQYYEQVELVTDSYGKQILVDALQLPYTSVRVELDQLNDYHPDLWALGKTIAYRLQEEPFIHADGDVYLYERLPAALEAAPLIAQHLEADFPYYAPHYEMMEQVFEYIPECMLQDRAQNPIFNAYCAGLLGGQDYAFFKEYAREVFALIDRNAHLLDKLIPNHLNVLFDQYLFYCLTQQERKTVHCFAEGVTLEFKGFTDFKGVPHRQKYIHPVDVFKKYKTNCELLAYRLRLDYPDYYYRILSLLAEFKI